MGVGSVYIVWCVVRQIRTRVHRWQFNSNFSTASVPIIEIRDDSWSWAETKNILTGVSTLAELKIIPWLIFFPHLTKHIQLRGLRLHNVRTQSMDLSSSSWIRFV